MSTKKTMTLNLTEDEMAVVEELARKKDLSKTGLMRQALRLYQLLDARLLDGDKILLEDKEKKISELVII